MKVLSEYEMLSKYHILRHRNMHNEKIKIILNLIEQKSQINYINYDYAMYIRNKLDTSKITNELCTHCNFNLILPNCDNSILSNHYSIACPCCGLYKSGL